MSERSLKDSTGAMKKVTFKKSVQNPDEDEISSDAGTVEGKDSIASKEKEASGSLYDAILESIRNFPSRFRIRRVNNDSFKDHPHSVVRLETFSSLFRKPRYGLSKQFAALYVIIVVTGNHIIYMPYALKESGFPGVFMFLLCGINSFYCGLLIAWCRSILQEKWPECAESLPSPYTMIGLKAVGKWMEYAVLITLNLSLIISGMSLLVASVRAVNETIKPEMTCTLMIIFTLMLVPLSCIGNLKDLWWVVLLETAATIVFMVSLISLIFYDRKSYTKRVFYQDKSWVSLIKSFGMISFLLNTNGIFPSIQNEMLHRNIFPQSVGIGYLAILMLYLPLPIIGYAAYGEYTNHDIILNLKENSNLVDFTIILQIIFAVKILGTFLVKINPIFINIEYYANLPSEFGYKRCLFRSTIVLLILILGLGSRPYVKLVELLEITSLNLLTFIFPVIFYICLVFQGVSRKPYRRIISKKHWLMLIQILVVAASGCIAAMYVNRNEIDPVVQSNCYNEFFTPINRSCLLCYSFLYH